MKNKNKLEVGKYYQLKGNGNTCLTTYAGMESDKHKFYPYSKFGLRDTNTEPMNLSNSEINRYVYPV